MRRSRTWYQKNQKDIKDNQKEETSILRELLGWVVYIFAVICITYLVITFVGQRTRVSGESMAPTLHSGDNLIVDKISYRFSDPERYDIIVFPYQYQEGIYYIKRIIGLPGETVLIQDGKVYINGEELGETYGAELMDSAGIASVPIELGENEYFVLGDNRNNSSDSREASVGVLSGDDIMGKAFVRIWPLDSIGVIEHE
ncbi:MAG: signal peptidase I [Eubacteriales bacterium]